MSEPTPAVIIEGFHESTGKPRCVMLLVSYADKEAHIELPEAAPSGACEDGVETYRREVRQLARALLEAADAPQGIRWPFHPRPSQP
jgi:hypothetical protein